MLKLPAEQAIRMKEMSKHIEMIDEFIVDGDSFQFFDNHGTITRCQDCRYFKEGWCDALKYASKPDFFCAKGERRDEA